MLEKAPINTLVKFSTYSSSLIFSWFGKLPFIPIPYLTLFTIVLPIPLFLWLNSQKLKLNLELWRVNHQSGKVMTMMSSIAYFSRYMCAARLTNVLPPHTKLFVDNHKVMEQAPLGRCVWLCDYYYLPDHVSLHSSEEKDLSDCWSSRRQISVPNNQPY